MNARTEARAYAAAVGQKLRDALSKADAVEALVVLPLIADAAKLVQQIDALESAIASRKGDK